MKIILLSLLTVLSTLLWAEPSCKLPEKSLLSYASSALDDKDWPETETMLLLPHHAKATIRWGSKYKGVKQYYNLEGFALLGDRKYRIVPGLGLGFRSDKKTLVYYCLEFSDYRDLKAKLVFFRKGFWTGDLKADPVNLEFLLASEAGLLLGTIIQGAGVPGVSEPQALLSEFDRLTNFFFKRVLSLGAAKVLLEKQQLWVYPKVKFAGIDLGFSPPIHLPYKHP